MHFFARRGTSRCHTKLWIKFFKKFSKSLSSQFLFLFCAISYSCHNKNCNLSPLKIRNWAHKNCCYWFRIKFPRKLNAHAQVFVPQTCRLVLWREGQFCFRLKKTAGFSTRNDYFGCKNFGFFRHSKGSLKQVVTVNEHCVGNEWGVMRVSSFENFKHLYWI